MENVVHRITNYAFSVNIVTSIHTSQYISGHPKVVKSIPGPSIPILTEAEKLKAKEIILNDSLIKKILEGKNYQLSDVGVVHSEGLEKTGAVVEIILDKNYWIETERIKKWGQVIIVPVDLKREQVGEQLIIMEGKGPKSQAVLPPEFTRAKEIVSNDATVQKMLKGKNYSAEIVGVWYKPSRPEGLVVLKTVFDRAYTDEYTWISKGKIQRMAIQATGLVLAVDLGSGKVVAVAPIKL